MKEWSCAGAARLLQVLCGCASWAAAHPAHLQTCALPRPSPPPADDELLTLHIAAVGDWTKSLLALVRDGRDDAGRVTGPCIPWWARRVHHQAGAAAKAAAAGTDVEAGGEGKGKGGKPSPAASEEEGAGAGAGGGSASVVLRPDLPTIYLQGPFGAPAMAFEHYRVLVLASTGVG